MTTQFDSGYLDSSITLSSGNRTATRTGAPPSGIPFARSDTSVTSGKYQFVIHANAWGGTGFTVIVGVRTSSDPTYGSVPSNMFQATSTYGSTLVVCINADTRKVYLGYWNGSTTTWLSGGGNPTTGAGYAVAGTDPIHIGVGFSHVDGSASLYTLASEMPMALVSGYSAWDSAGVQSYPTPATMDWNAPTPIVTNPVPTPGFEWSSPPIITSPIVPENYFGFDNPPPSQAIGANVPTVDMGWITSAIVVPARPSAADMGWTTPSLAVPLYAPTANMGWSMPVPVLPATPTAGDMGWSAPEPYAGMASYVAVPADFRWEVLGVRATSREALNDFWFFSDNPTAQFRSTIRDEWGWVDTPILSTVSSLSIPDSWGWAESPLIVGVLVLSDLWSWNDSPASLSQSEAFLSDDWAWNDSHLLTLSLSVAVSDSWRWSEYLADAYRVSLSDTWDFSDSPMTWTLLASVSAQDTWSWSESLALNVSLIGSVVDSWGWQDAPIARLLLSIGVNDIWTWQDSLSTGQASVYSVNLDTGAISRYVLPKSILSAAWHQGKLYLATSTGLYVMNGSTDDGAPIQWNFRTSMLDFGTDQLKRLNDLNVSCRATGDIAAKVVTDRAGTKREDLFILRRQTREATRDGVIKIGRGLVSPYWQIGLSGVGPAEISEVRVMAEPLSRRK